EIGGFFEWVAQFVVRHARSPRVLLAAVVALSGLLSALFVNDTICLMLTPLLIAVVRPLGLPPLPFLIGIALAANVGSAMTPIGNPQNMLIAVASHISFARFVGALALASVGGLVIVFGVLAATYRRALSAPLTRVALLDAPFDRGLVVRSLVAFGAALVGWLAGFPLPLVAITAAAGLIVIAQRDPSEAFRNVDWPLLLFFAALFVVMRGARDLPLVESLTAAAGAQLHGARPRDAAVTSAAMLVLSNLISNVPAVILWLPVVPRVPSPAFVWLVIAMSSTFAGNLTLLGSMANLIVAERAEVRGVRIPFWDYARVGIPVTVLTIVWGIATVLVAGPH
ncbi:MAG TPA: SLC13 family permease, partial [Gemmatimonadaceae bacterium]|nr:SLC13 family permease [Gemmatimonadaceae bacterium]